MKSIRAFVAAVFLPVIAGISCGGGNGTQAEVVGSAQQVFLQDAGIAALGSIDAYRLTVQPSGSGLFSITGDVGSANAGYLVRIRNSRLGSDVLVQPQSNGVFVGIVSALAGDRLELMLTDGTGTDGPVTGVYAGGFTIKNPYTAGGYWYVGQVHAHTVRSDGRDTPQALEAAYYDAGYDFVVSTDHRGTLPWSYNGLTPDPDNGASGKDLLWIRGTELGFGKVHMGAWGHTAYTPFDASVSIQSRINTVRSNGGITVMNHPENVDPPYAWDWNSEIKTTHGYSMVEAFNAKHPPAQGMLNHKLDAVDLADDFRQVWWIGADDCHDINDPSQFNRYAIVVHSDSASISQGDVLRSADAGDMYIRESAAGPEISAVEVVGNTVSVRLADVSSNYNVVWKKRGDEVVKQELVDTVSSYVVQGNEGYVRADIERVDDGLKAYIQPLFIGNSQDLSVSATVASGTGASKLVDNNSSTTWDAGAGSGSFIIDVGTVRQVNAVKIDWLDTDARRFNYRIEASETGAFRGEEVEVVRETYHNRSAQTLDFFDVYARYIRVMVTGQTVGVGDTVVIREVEVFDASPSGTDLYVDNVNGDDANSGLAGSPWRTFDVSRDRARPRDTVHLLNTGVPFGGMMSLYTTHSGKHPNAIVRYQGDVNTLTGIDAVGDEYGIRFSGTRYVEWSHFDIYGARDGNILVYEGTDKSTAIQYNRIRDGEKRGIRASGSLTLAYNLVYGNVGQGVFLYRDGVEAGIYNNVIYGNQSGLVLPSYNINVDVRNNIVSGNTDVALYETSTGIVTDSYNCIDGGYVGDWQRSFNIEALPMFVDPNSGNFRLQAGSPCIDAGIDLGIAADFTGNSPFDVASVPNGGSPGQFSFDYTDIGAYEFIP